MAEFTKLDDKGIASLARTFGLGEVVSWRPIAAGTINSNFALETADGRFFLRINEGKSEQDVAYEARLLGALCERGVRTPLACTTSAGQRYAPWQGQFASMFPWVDGTHRAVGQVTPRDAAAVGSALATVHGAGAGLAEAFDNAGIYGQASIAARLEAVAHEPPEYLAPYVASLSEEVAWLGRRAAIREAAPRGIIHGDLFRDNLLFTDDGGVCLLDFEQASVGSLVYDIAVTVNAWCFVEAFDGDLVRALLGGYQRCRVLEPTERDALWIELRAAAMRFTVTRITDVYLPKLDAPGKEFQRYFRRLEAWREADRSTVATYLSAR